MRKRGISLSFNAIVIAAIALVVLIVILLIYTGFIGRTSESLSKPAEAAGEKANDAAWCMPAYISGGTCVMEGASSCGTGCVSAEIVLDPKTKKCSLTCKEGYPHHKIAGGITKKTYECSDGVFPRYCCCQTK